MCISAVFSWHLWIGPEGGVIWWQFTSNASDEGKDVPALQYVYLALSLSSGGEEQEVHTRHIFAAGLRCPRQFCEGGN